MSVVTAAQALGDGDRPPPARQMRLKKWKPHRSGALVGFASAQLAFGLIVRDLMIMTGNNGLWAAMPARRQLDRKGLPKSDVKGMPIYNQIIEPVDRATATRFGAMVLDELVQRGHPGEIEDGGAR